jgi:hypothetical protein
MLSLLLLQAKATGRDGGGAQPRCGPSITLIRAALGCHLTPSAAGDSDLNTTNDSRARLLQRRCRRRGDAKYRDEKAWA